MCIVREMKEELGVDVAIKLVGDESVWAVTDDDVNGTLWRCNFFIFCQTDPDQEPQVSQLFSQLPLSHHFYLLPFSFLS